MAIKCYEVFGRSIDWRASKEPLRALCEARDRAFVGINGRKTPPVALSLTPRGTLRDAVLLDVFSGILFVLEPCRHPPTT